MLLCKQLKQTIGKSNDYEMKKKKKKEKEQETSKER